MTVITAKNELISKDKSKSYFIVIWRKSICREEMCSELIPGRIVCFLAQYYFSNCNEFASILATYEAEKYIAFIYHKKGRTMTTKTKTGNKGFKLESKLHATKKVWKCVNYLQKIHNNDNTEESNKQEKEGQRLENSTALIFSGSGSGVITWCLASEFCFATYGTIHRSVSCYVFQCSIKLKATIFIYMFLFITLCVIVM